MCGVCLLPALWPRLLAVIARTVYALLAESYMENMSRKRKHGNTALGRRPCAVPRAGWVVLLLEGAFLLIPGSLKRELDIPGMKKRKSARKIVLNTPAGPSSSLGLLSLLGLLGLLGLVAVLAFLWAISWCWVKCEWQWLCS